MDASAADPAGSGGVGVAPVPDGTVTPGFVLGNGAMSREPWNLWKDATAPATSLTASEVGPPASSMEKQAEELASALAAASLTEETVEVVEKIGKRTSLNTWAGEMDIPSDIQAAAFTLDADKSGQPLHATASTGDLTVRFQHY